jgi:hypothetical protein
MFAAVILLASLALMVQFSLPSNTAGRVNVLYSYILVFFKAFCGLDTLLIVPVIFK